MKPNILAAVIFSFLAAGAASAQEGPIECKDDAEQFCPGLMPGDMRLIECLGEHEAELSEGCKARGQEVKKEVSSLTETCKSDLEQFCADVKGGTGAKIRCLKTNEDMLSKGCKAKMAADKRRFQKNRRNAGQKADRKAGQKPRMKKNPCAADIKEFCDEVEPGGGGILRCLKENEENLSEACLAHQKKMQALAKKRGDAQKKRRPAASEDGEDAPEPPSEQEEN